MALVQYMLLLSRTVTDYINEKDCDTYILKPLSIYEFESTRTNLNHPILLISNLTNELRLQQILGICLPL